MGKKLTVKEIDGYSKNTNQGFDNCSICDGIELKGKMIEIEPNSNNWDLVCEECNAKLEDVSKRYPYMYEKPIEQFEKTELRDFKVGDLVTTYKNIHVITNSTYHDVLRMYRGINFKVDTNTNNIKKEFDKLSDAIDFAQLIAMNTSYENYYVTSNLNGMFYVIEVSTHAQTDIGIVLTNKF